MGKNHKPGESKRKGKGVSINGHKVMDQKPITEPELRRGKRKT